jgi:hypothetical protein
MMTTLRHRVERLEQFKPRSSLEDLPDEALEKRFSLLAHMYVHGLAGHPIEEFRQEHQAMGPLHLERDPERPINEDQLHERVVSILRADAGGNEDYRRLLEMLGEAGLVEGSKVAASRVVSVLGGPGRVT